MTGVMDDGETVVVETFEFGNIQKEFERLFRKPALKLVSLDRTLLGMEVTERNRATLFYVPIVSDFEVAVNNPSRATRGSGSIPCARTRLTASTSTLLWPFLLQALRAVSARR